MLVVFFFFFQAEDGIRDADVTGVQTCALPICTVIGVGEASYAVVTPSLLSDLYPPERRARVFAIFYAAIPAGTALGYALGGTIGSAFGWRTAFFAAGIPGAALALTLLCLAEPKRGASDAV